MAIINRVNTEKKLIFQKIITGGQELLVKEKNRETSLEILAPNGIISLSIVITEEGPILNFGTSNLKIQTQGDFEIEAENLKFNAKQSLSLSCGGDINLKADGDMDSHACTQNITADLGNTNIKANDDIKMNGERIMVNC